MLYLVQAQHPGGRSRRGRPPADLFVGAVFGLPEVARWRDRLAPPAHPGLAWAGGQLGTGRRLLRGLGARADILPLLGMALGLAVPAIAATVAPVAIWLLALTVFCGFMSLDRAGVGGAELQRALATLPVVWLLSPAACWAATRALGGDAELAGWMALVGAAPVASVAAVYAGALGLPTRTIGLLALASTLGAPLVLPLAALAFADGSVAAEDVARRVGPAVLLPAALALLLARRPTLTDGRVLGRADWRGLSAMALTGLGIARVDELVPLVMVDPAQGALFVGLGVLAAAIGGLLVALCGWPGGLRAALVAGGCRNVALVWAVTLPMLPPEGQLFMSLTLVPTYAIPAIVRRLPCR